MNDVIVVKGVSNLESFFEFSMAVLLFAVADLLRPSVVVMIEKFAVMNP